MHVVLGQCAGKAGVSSVLAPGTETKPHESLLCVNLTFYLTNKTTSTLTRPNQSCATERWASKRSPDPHSLPCHMCHTRAARLWLPTIMVPTPSSVSSSMSSECGCLPSMMCVARTPWARHRIQHSTCAHKSDHKASTTTLPVRQRTAKFRYHGTSAVAGFAHVQPKSAAACHYLGNHAAGDDSLCYELPRVLDVELRELGGYVVLVPHHARHIRHEDQFLCFQRRRHLVTHWVIRDASR